MLASKFLRLFWVTTAGSAIVFTILAHAYRPAPHIAYPWIASFPFSKTEYVMGSHRGIVDHLLYRFGLFGDQKRIEQSDILIAGTSHPMFGISAELLGRKLSENMGRPVRAFNLGLGYAESAYTARFLRDNEVRDKWIILDLFAPEHEGESAWAENAERLTRWKARVLTLSVWAEETWDWLIDPVYPLVSVAYPDNPPLAVRRSFDGFQTRYWESGDAARFCNSWGLYYGRGVTPPAAMIHPIGTDPGHIRNMPDLGMALPKAWRELFERNHLHPILLLIPFEGYDPKRAEKIAEETGYPLVTLSADGLELVDDEHLGSASRDKATQELAEEILRRDLIPKETLREGSGTK